MAWIMDEYGKKNGYTPAIVTGKPVNLGGSLGREEATGRGVTIITREACAAHGIDLRSARVAIQGYGNVGSWTARLMRELGVKVVAVSDVFGAVFDERGLEIPELDKHVRETGKVVDFAHAKNITNGELLSLSVDILVPAALGGALTSANAETVKAKIIVEGANSPTTPRADEILRRRNVIVVPDILANAGGVTVSYFEWVQNLQQFSWTLEKVNQELETRMVRAWKNVHERSAKEKLPLRVAAYADALGKVALATRQRV
jgi:glutamate dehydrogenase/leucine dehydrogenase